MAERYQAYLPLQELRTWLESSYGVLGYMSSLSAAMDPSLVTVARVRLVADHIPSLAYVRW